MKKNGTVALLLLVAFVLALAPPALAAPRADAGIKVYINGSRVAFPDEPPWIDAAAGRVLVPLRFVSEALGAKVDWNGETRTVTVERSQVKVRLTIGNKKVTRNDQAITLDVAPYLTKKGRTLVPLRFVSEALGANVDWRENERAVYITDGQANAGAGNGSGGTANTKQAAEEIWRNAKPYVGQPLDHGKFGRQSWDFQQAEEVSFVTLQDLPARVGTPESGHVIVSIDLSEAETKNRIIVKQVAMGNIGPVGVYNAEMIFWMKGDDVSFASQAAEWRSNIITVYQPLYGRDPKDIKYFAFYSDGQILAVKNPLYRGD